jgi:hypothetical protein
VRLLSFGPVLCLTEKQMPRKACLHTFGSLFVSPDFSNHLRDKK